MGKRPLHDDMDMDTIRREISTLNARMTEVITILGGSSAYGVAGMKSDVRDLKKDVLEIKDEMAKLKRETEEKEKKQGFLNIKLDTVPQKIAGLVAFAAVLLTMIQSLKTLFTQVP